MGQFDQMMKDVRAAFNSGKTRTYEWRIAQLKSLVKMLEENSQRFSEVLYQDLHKPHMEANVMEVQMCLGEAIDSINELSNWMKPEKVKKGAMYMMDTAYIKPEPYGVALVIGAWNYPVQLVLAPIIGAIAAGNCVVIKPSELSEATAELFAELIPKYMDNDCIKLVNGGVTETTDLLAEKFDIILYTGNGTVARIIMAAASKHLTPVILELGGKSPVYIDKDTDIVTVAKRVCWGKYANAGQTCIAPDYIMCPKELQGDFVRAAKEAIKEFFGEDPSKSDSYGRVVNKRHFQRIQKLKEGAKVATEGKDVEEDKYVAPTILEDVKLSDPVMKEEIFGPVMPVLTVEDHNEAIKIINDGDKPLAMYIFTNNKSLVQEFRDRTSSGALLVNDTVVHAALTTLPFGGVGGSGMGAYHGKFSFTAFSHMKPVLEKSLGMESLQKIRYPPYTEKKLGWVKWLMQKKVKKTGLFAIIPFMILSTMMAVMVKAVGVTALGLPGSANKNN